MLGRYTTGPRGNISIVRADGPMGQPQEAMRDERGSLDKLEQSAEAAGGWGFVTLMSIVCAVGVAFTLAIIIVALTPWLWLPTAGVAVFIVLMSFWKTFGPGR